MSNAPAKLFFFSLLAMTEPSKTRFDTPEASEEKLHHLYWRFSHFCQELFHSQCWLPFQDARVMGKWERNQANSSQWNWRHWALCVQAPQSWGWWGGHCSAAMAAIGNAVSHHSPAMLGCLCHFSPPVSWSEGEGAWAAPVLTPNGWVQPLEGSTHTPSPASASSWCCAGADPILMVLPLCQCYGDIWVRPITMVHRL